jgi:ADP-heptose:LPS heptosyltransferase
MVLCESVSQRLKGLTPDEYVIVDPDSRLTQLGMLPLVSGDSGYYFFESRSYSLPAVEPLSLLAGCWLDEVFGFAQPLTRQAVRKPFRRDESPGYRPEYPYVALPADDVARGKSFRTLIEGRLAAVNLGIGGNAEKRIDDPFEADLLAALLHEGYTLVLDRGAGEEELARTERLKAELRGRGKVVKDVPPTATPAAPDDTPADAYVWEGSLSGFGGLIAQADLYCGYDSAGGHLAAAMGAPVITLFTDAQRPKFIQRWTPWGEGPVQAITARRSAPREALRQFRAALREQPR